MSDDEMTDEEIEEHLATLDTTCALCGKETHGAASIGEKFYCHQDVGPTCYMRAQWTEQASSYLSALDLTYDLNDIVNRAHDMNDTPIYDQAYSAAIDHVIEVDDIESMDRLEAMDEDTRPTR